MSWVYLDDKFCLHPKVALAGGDAGWLYICGLTWVNLNLTAGDIPKALIPQLSDRKKPTALAKRLVEVGLWEDRGDYFHIHDYEQHNASAETRRAKAKKAANARWSKTEQKPLAKPDAPSIASSNAQTPPEDMQKLCLPPSPKPLVTTVKQLSSSDSAEHDDDDEGISNPAVAREAFQIVARRRLERRESEMGPVGERAAWVRYVANVTAREMRGQAQALLSKHSTLSAEELADWLEPPVWVPVNPKPPTPAERNSAAERARIASADAAPKLDDDEYDAMLIERGVMLSASKSAKAQR